LRVPELWSFIEFDFVKHRACDTAFQMASEAKRDAKILEAKPCGIIFSPYVPDELKRYGLEKVYFFETTEAIPPEIVAENIYSQALNNQPKMILFPSSATGAEIGSRVAAKLQGSFISNCIDFEVKGREIIARRPIYRGVANQYVKFLGDPPYVATIDLKSLDAVEEEEREIEVIHIQIENKKSKTRILRRWKLPPSEMPITEASVVIGVGGAVDKEFMPVIEELSEYLEGAIGATRVAVDKGLVSVDRQIGATGKFINADVYIAVGISGSTRHTVGISNVKHIIAINIDKNANIFKLSELEIVDDLYEVIPRLVEFLSQIKEGAE